MNPDLEIRRLLDVMPASGRMLTKIIPQPEQPTVLAYRPGLPWNQERPVLINFDLWHQLPEPQRDLLMLSTVQWLTASNWLKPNLYLGLALAGAVGAIAELVQGDMIGFAVAGGLSALAGTQIRRINRGLQLQLEAAVHVAQRRGYSEAEAAQHLFSAIQAVAKLEGQAQPTFDQLIRCQNLRAIAGLSKTSVPEILRE